MVILDIDQDFFFNPIINGDINSVKPEDVYKYNQKMIEDPLVVFTKYQKGIGANTPVYQFTNHDEVGKLIVSLGKKNITLHHLDSHSDIDMSVINNIRDINVGNWVSCTAEYYDNVFWILPDLIAAGTDVVTSNMFPFTTRSLSSVESPEKIDMICWTSSPEWCPQTIDLFSIFRDMVKNISGINQVVR